MSSASPLRVLVVAPHADDETLGAGGSIARFVRAGHQVTVAVMTGHGEEEHPLWPRRVWDTVRDEAREAHAALGVAKVIYREVPAACVAEYPSWKLNREAGEVLDEVKPDLLFVPFALDLHKDHREIFNAFSVAWRPTSEVSRGVREIYAYETLSETHWNVPYVEQGFLPNVHVDISETLETKLRALACFKTQMRPAPATRSLQAARAQAVWRGAQIGTEAAEAFVLVRRII
jgi:N-acetylglucosamine malate deacetylase 1